MVGTNIRETSSGSKKNVFEFFFCGKKIIFEIDKIAIKSDKSILCRYGKTTILTVLTVKELDKESGSNFPLKISMDEKFYAIGRIPGSFEKREGKPSHDSITTSRLIDRSLRPFFPEDAKQEVQLTNSVLSVDEKNDPRLAAL
jgi:polyribonucleotide nucleotidyltransferase